MKNIFLGIAVATTLFSCSKEEEIVFQATETTGTTVVEGTITRSDFLSGNEVALEGAMVTVRIDNADLYPNSPNAQGSETYTGVSDANGKYSISAKTNGEGVLGRVTYSPVTLVVDPATGEEKTYSSTATTNLTLYTGVAATNDRLYGNSTNVDISNITVDTGIVRGTIEIQHWVQNSSTSTTYSLENLPLSNHTVVLIYDQDPTTLVERVYQTVTDVNGDYSFLVETADFDYNLDNDYRVVLPDFDSAQDSLLSNGSVLSSTPGVFLEESRTGSIEGGDVDNARDLLYNNFIED